MGACQSNKAGDGTDLDRDRQINAEIKKKRDQEDRIIKLLLLGAGESGKSTIFKQLKVIHQNNFTEAERDSYVRLVRSNVVDNMKNIYRGIENNDMGLDAPAEADKDFVMEFSFEETPFDEEVAKRISALWSNPSIQQAYGKRSMFQLDDSAAYFFENVLRIADPSFAPTNEDIFHTRVRTTGIHEIQFTIEGVDFRLTDVGGQRSERRKWIHCFEDVTALVFVAAISEYDQVLFEDNKTNRMRESLDIFREISNSRWFQKTAMILFLNKEDLFKKKLEVVPLKDCFDEYDGDDYESAIDFLKHQFLSQLDDPDKQVYIHVTCAMNTGNIRFVFDAIKDIILEYNVIDSGMM